MNASIYGMNHSPKTEERESQPLERENDINVLHQELCSLKDDEFARKFYDGLRGGDYTEKCRAYVIEIDRICEAMPVLDIEALVAFAEDVEAPLDVDEFLIERESELAYKFLDGAFPSVADMLELNAIADWRISNMEANDAPHPDICTTDTIQADKRIIGGGPAEPYNLPRPLYEDKDGFPY
jgi:hypothetical protein